MRSVTEAERKGITFSTNSAATSRSSRSMARVSPCLWAMVLVVTTTFQLQMVATLRVGYYAQSCPNAEAIVGNAMARHMQVDSGTAPGVLRLQFHDCFVDGCDGSVLLDGPNTEKTAQPNLTLRGFEAIDAAKADLEAECPGVVSCADILAFAARDAVVMTGGLRYPVQAGRLDGRFSNAGNVGPNTPDPGFNVNQILAMFESKGLTQSDMVVLSGAHTIGRAHCESVRFGCARGATFDLDSTPQEFDSDYYNKLVNGQGMMHSDQVLFDDMSTRPETTLNAIATAPWEFRFGQIMIKMGNIEVKTGSQGEVRRNCRVVN